MMDRERLFAELCLNAPPMPETWSPAGVDRIPTAHTLGPDGVRALYTSMTGLVPDKSRDAAFVVWDWFKGVKANQDTELTPYWRVHYARSVLAAMEGV
jgi:hypothetical protein